MSNALGALFLKADKVLVPWEIIGGAKQVSAFVTVYGNKQKVFSLIGNDRDLGPIKLERVILPPDKMKVWLDERIGTCETIIPKHLRVTEWSFRYAGSIETVIYAIELFEESGRSLRLSREGAAYPYTLALAGKLEESVVS